MRFPGFMRLASLLAFALMTAAAGPARAFEFDLGSLEAIAPVGSPDSSPIPRGLVLGGVFIGANARYEGQDDLALPIPGAVYFGERFLYLGDRARYYFYRDGNFAAFGYGRVRFGNLDPDDAPELRGMDERKGQFELGLGANVITPYALLTFRAAGDVTGRSKGGEALAWSDFPMVMDRWLVMPGVGLLWRSSKLANYYFGGVGANEVAPGRPQHDTGSTLSAMASLVTTYRFSRDWIGTFIVGLEHFDDGTADSPIVGHQNEYTLITGVGYVW